DRSASRGEMATRALYVFEHESALGNSPAHHLFDRIGIERLAGESPPRRFEDYAVTVDLDQLPAGVTFRDLTW
ncbi:MAG TPA: type I CRISPR-associated protein Cas7, partial [Thermoanaerobaculia bacterium]|nr:type I CRISPR-associated protein Cas7 [Thermoanaerobaculia bacterium]